MILAYVYNNYGEALEYDMFHLWGVDINTVSLRRMANFFSRLPQDSETMLDMANVSREARLWSIDTWTMANAIDVLQMINYGIQSANSRHAPPKPKPYPRPGLKPKPKKLWPGKTIVDRTKK